MRMKVAGRGSALLWAEEAQRRARRALYTEEALREQQEEGRRVREAYRRAQAGAPGSGRGGDTRRRYGSQEGTAGAEAAADPTGRTYRLDGRTVADYYEVLEVSPRARQAVIEKAYRTLMREEHPDQGGDPRRAQLLNEAYEVLRDPVKRQTYDAENGLS